MNIEAYSFGSIKVDGRTYTQDVIVFPDRVRPEWWRVEGHSLAEEDLREIFEFSPGVLVIGKGAYGVMRVPAETERLIEDRGITLIAEKTAEACDTFNSLEKKGENVVGAFHLTC